MNKPVLFMWHSEEQNLFLMSLGQTLNFLPGFPLCVETTLCVNDFS